VINSPVAGKLYLLTILLMIGFEFMWHFPAPAIKAAATALLAKCPAPAAVPQQPQQQPPPAQSHQAPVQPQLLQPQQSQPLQPTRAAAAVLTPTPALSTAAKPATLTPTLVAAATSASKPPPPPQTQPVAPSSVPVRPAVVAAPAVPAATTFTIPKAASLHKEQGNAAFKLGQFGAAIDSYTACLAAVDGAKVYTSNAFSLLHLC
jgi:hypothetical protein